mmetsp:Transcript_6516/g.9858  ORF Transcript_6516/g.9858 Transcript_6516/m.9858 type:complete len:479 (-) Transcript_6516:74-1510(-)
MFFPVGVNGTSARHATIASRATTYVIMASSSVAIVTWSILQWRARKRARSIAANAERMVQDGMMINCNDPKVRTRVLNNAIKCAQKWMSFLDIDNAKPMSGQVGGVSFHKRPMLTLAPDYILKPLHIDHRGFREIAFYEAIKQARRQAALSDIAREIRDETKNSATDALLGSVALENCDALAMWLAMFTEDAVVAESEHTLVSSWRAVLREVELLRRLSTFTAEYYGVIGQDLIKEDPTVGSVPLVSEISSNSYLLLADATVNFSKPCAIDLKMGRRSYEPDATLDKQRREISKYPLQAVFGFRIVGMRVYDPSHPEADHLGFRKFEKSFGRSLGTRQSVVDAFRTFFHRIDNPAESDASVCGGSQRYERSSSEIGDKFNDEIRTRPICNLLRDLRCLKNWFEDNKSLAFYSSSILMVYEGDTSVGSNRDVANVKMIDFGHVRRESGGDEGYLHGLRTIIGILNEIVGESNEVDSQEF